MDQLSLSVPVIFVGNAPLILALRPTLVSLNANRPNIERMMPTNDACAKDNFHPDLGYEADGLCK
jgi:hypothetical protein